MKAMPASTQPSKGHTKPVKLCIREETLAIIDRAAQLQGRSRSDFMIDASCKAAEDAILEPSVIITDKAAYGRFQAMLDAPSQLNDKLRKTMRAVLLWERQ